MKKIEEKVWALGSCSTCQHKKRVFHAFLNGGKLFIAEVILGDGVRCVAVQTRVDRGETDYRCVACCSFGEHILVMTGKKGNVFAALVDVDEGTLGEGTVHITALAVSGDKHWTTFPHLCQAGESRVLLFFEWLNDVRYCDIADTTLEIKRLDVEVPAKFGFSVTPIRLPDGKLLVAGADSDSPAIIQISCDGNPQFEKVGVIPGAARRRASSVLVRDRFVVGFGGQGDCYLDDLWIFDLQTCRSSIVWEKGEWTRSLNSLVVILQDDVLYILDYKAHSITLQALSELIDDDEIRDTFCAVLGLPSISRYVPPPREIFDLSNMKKLAGSVPVKPYNIVQYKGRILHFSISRKELVVSEVIFFGRRVKLVPVCTGISAFGNKICCCLLGKRILVISGREKTANCQDDAENSRGIRSYLGSGILKKAKMFAALVDVDEGRLSKETVHTTVLKVDGAMKWPGLPYLSQVEESRALLLFRWQRSMLYCDVVENTLLIRMLKTQMPPRHDFDVFPIRLSKGKVLAVGTNSKSIDIVQISCDKRLQFEKVGGMRGRASTSPSSILIGDRILMGLRECDNDFNGFWIFDIKTGRNSRVGRKGEWPPENELVPLVIQNDILYLLGETTSCISLAAIAGLINEEKLRRDFSWQIGLPFTPSSYFVWKNFRRYIPLCF